MAKAQMSAQQSDEVEIISTGERGIIDEIMDDGTFWVQMDSDGRIVKDVTPDEVILHNSLI